MKESNAGLGAWLLQRGSAVYMLFFMAFLLVHFIGNPPLSYGEWRDWVISPGTLITFALFFGVLFLHAWVGIRDVIMDYIHAAGLRVTTLVLASLYLLGMAAWVAVILFTTRSQGGF